LSRIVVLGGTGYFGRLAALELRSVGLLPVVAARRSGDVLVDVEDEASIRAALCEGDVAVDVVGPFQARSTRLVESAIAIGFHVVDVSDSPAYAERVAALADRIAEAGITVCSSCSSLSVVSAALVRLSGIESPTRVSAFLRPASGHTAHPGTADSALRSVGRPIRVLRGGALTTVRGLGSSRVFHWPSPVGRARGRLFESADAVNLPKIWPSLREVDFWVDPNVPGLGALLALAARVPLLRWLFERTKAIGILLARTLGGTRGVFAVEVEDDGGRTVRLALTGPSKTERTAVVPAALAARAIASGEFHERGLVPTDRQVDGAEVLAVLSRTGIGCTRDP
jgi:hypothetical protein